MLCRMLLPEGETFKYGVKSGSNTQNILSLRAQDGVFEATLNNDRANLRSDRVLLLPYLQPTILPATFCGALLLPGHSLDFGQNVEEFGIPNPIRPRPLVRVSNLGLINGVLEPQVLEFNGDDGEAVSLIEGEFYSYGVDELRDLQSEPDANEGFGSFQVLTIPDTELLFVAVIPNFISEKFGDKVTNGTRAYIYPDRSL